MSALDEARRLQAIMTRRGVKCTVELKAGRPWSGDVHHSRKHVLQNHHTAGSMNGLTPSYALCRNGRSGLPGPLCLAAGSSVLTGRGLVPVESVRVGDLAWTHRGRWRPVTATMSREAVDVRRLRAPGIDMTCTSDHPWLSEDGQWVPTEEASTLVHADALDVALPLPDIDGFTATPELLRLAGAWVADGYIHKAKRKVGYKHYPALSVRSEKLPTVGKWLTAAGIDWWQTQDRKTSVVLLVRSVSLAAWLVEHFGEYSDGKTVPAWLLGHREHAAAFLDGYLHGDGSEIPANDRHGEYTRCSTVSRTLAFGVVLLARSLDCHAYLAGMREGKASLVINGKQTSGKDCWMVDVYQPGRRRLLKYRACEQGLAVNVTAVNPVAPCSVYDITVDEDHSMLVDGVWSHNCNGYGGRDHVYRIVTLGLANHPGAGGPLTVDGFTIPKDGARISVWGTEWEHNGTSPWPADMREFMGRANAALLEWMAVGLGRSIEHSTWATPAGRKIDRNGYTAARGQAEIAPFLTATTEDDDMSAVAEQQIADLHRIFTTPIPHRVDPNVLPPRQGTPVDFILDSFTQAHDANKNVQLVGAWLGTQTFGGDVDVAKLAESLRAQLAPDLAAELGRRLAGGA